MALSLSLVFGIIALILAIVVAVMNRVSQSWLMIAVAVACLAVIHIAGSAPLVIR